MDTSGALNTVTGYGPDYVDVNLERHETSVIVLPGAPVQAWPVSSFDALAPEHFAMLLDPTPELVIRQRRAAALPAPAARRGAHGEADRRRDDGFPGGLPHLQHPDGRGPQVAAALLIER